MARPNHLNIDDSEEKRLRRIRCTAQVLILKKLNSPHVSREEKDRLAEKILLSKIDSVPVPPINVNVNQPQKVPMELLERFK